MRARSQHFDPIGITIVSLVVFLITAIVVTLYFQQRSAVVVFKDTPPPNEYVIAAKTPLEPEELIEPVLEEEPEILIVNTEGFSQYIEVSDSCGPHYEGECLRVRSGPGLDYPVVTTLRNGIVLKVAGSEVFDGVTWYEITFDEWLRYPERVSGKWYVAADFVELFYDEGIQTKTASSSSTKKTITVDRSEQSLTAYQGEKLFLQTAISTGIEMTPTPRGIFTIFRKTPTRYMQGPLPYLAISKYYDLPGVPWNLYFTEQGAVIHGTYWHDSFGHPYSSGCVNVEPQVAQTLYGWAEVGTTVIVQD